MRILKKTLILSIAFVFMIVTLSSFDSQITTTSLNIATDRPINVGVLLYDSNDSFLSLIQKNLENIQNENEDKVKYTFFDGKRNPAINYEIANKLAHADYDLLLMNIVTASDENTQQVISNLKKRNIPFVIFISEINPNSIGTYKKAIIIGSNEEEPGTAQGKIIVDAWNSNKNAIDRNKDNKLQYVMLKGNPKLAVSIARANSAIATIKNAKIETEELASINSYWDKDLARTAMESLFLRYGNKIDAIISNNDAMAIGAIEALQKYGYNKGNKTKTIPVVGFDAIPEAQELIKKGIMLGSVLNDATIYAEVLYNVGMNLVLDRNPVAGTDYMLDPSGTVVYPPKEEFKPITAEQLKPPT